MQRHKRIAPRGEALVQALAGRTGDYSVLRYDRGSYQPLPCYPDGPPMLYLDRTGHKCYGWCTFRVNGHDFRVRWDSDGCGNAPAIWVRIGGKRYQISEA
jgi:hypothetical protein